jgi:hypothetical protein
MNVEAAMEEMPDDHDLKMKQSMINTALVMLHDTSPNTSLNVGAHLRARSYIDYVESRFPSLRISRTVN